MSRSLTDGLWLMELKQQGAVVQMEGRATSLTAVTDFVERLQDSGVFDRPVEIVSTSMELLDDTSVVRFAVKAQARGQPQRRRGRQPPSGKATESWRRASTTCRRARSC